ncbi:hypothetical protein HYALB_00003886 [Hymenoscyphus albidus]|uniref:Uncharacterized protein n=1 Tax=Hymenoscyphus albidus TaxID=595503 RepID=A0A9N9QBA2_9HELO|nr:hypothetical protein HYALB_00003886 [Hymenoscyphus albidus]
MLHGLFFDAEAVQIQTIFIIEFLIDDDGRNQGPLGQSEDEKVIATLRSLIAPYWALFSMEDLKKENEQFKYKRNTLEKMANSSRSDDRSDIVPTSTVSNDPVDLSVPP